MRGLFIHIFRRGFCFRYALIGLRALLCDDRVPRPQTAFDGGVNFIDTCMSVSYPAEAIARAIHGKRASLIMQNHLCAGYPHGEYQHLLKLSEVKDAFAMELKKYGTDYSDIGTIHFIDEESDLRRLIDTGVNDYCWKVHLLRSLYCGKLYQNTMLILMPLK